MYFGEEKMKTREWSNLKLFQNYPFWTYIKKKLDILFFGVWSFLLVHIQFTLLRGPKAL